ncbi:MAG: radical SAM protein [Paludibacteraceae bacterium]|nr:radical SAM protein [Paludibacteraceae bacterium]
MFMLFDKIVYGPIHSRRLGTSLGVNLLPTHAKICTFDCIYCECGWNQPIHHPTLPTLAQVHDELEKTLKELKEQCVELDVITFSGNGEPTLHPDFLKIIQETCQLRSIYYPNAKVSVLSNATQLTREDVIEALRLCDNRILKLDSAIDTTMLRIDQPLNKDLTVERIVKSLQVFKGDFTLQTCFLQGDINGVEIDNTTPHELEAWFEVVRWLNPKQIMIYVIDRATPLQTINKVPAEKMNAIAQRLRQEGFNVIVSI